MAQPSDLGIIGHLVLLLTFRKNMRPVFVGYFETVKLYCERYGTITGLALVTLFAPEAPRLIERIETNVLPAKPRDVKEFMTSLSSGFNMTGVAAAIIVQVAVTGIVSNDGGSLHWTVNACYEIGAVSAGLSVYFACVAHPGLRGLDGPEDIKAWLSQPAARNKHQERHRYASAYSVMMLLAPNRLLSIAVPPLLIGLGIPLGILTADTSKRPPGSGLAQFLPQFIIYLCIIVFGLAVYYLPQVMRELEKQEEIQSLGLLPRSTSRNGTHQHNQQNYEMNTPLTSAAATHRRSSDTTPASTAGMPREQRFDRLGSTAASGGTKDHHRVISHVVRDNLSEKTDDMDYSPIDGTRRQQQDGLDSILRELITAQDQCTNITGRLLEYHHQKQRQNSAKQEQ